MSFKTHYNPGKAISGTPCVTQYRPIVQVSYGTLCNVLMLVREKLNAVGRRVFSSGEMSGEQDCFDCLVKCELTSVEC